MSLNLDVKLMKILIIKTQSFLSKCVPNLSIRPLFLSLNASMLNSTKP